MIGISTINHTNFVNPFKQSKFKIVVKISITMNFNNEVE